MTSEVAKALDSTYNRMQWAGEEYLLEELVDVSGEKITNDGEVYSKEVLYWMGYIYRYWHYYTNEDSSKIYKQAPVGTMKRNYLMFHTMAPELAIEDLKEMVTNSQLILFLVQHLEKLVNLSKDIVIRVQSLLLKVEFRQAVILTKMEQEYLLQTWL